MALLFVALWLAMAEEKQATGFGCAEVERDGTGLFGVPAWKGDVRLGGLESDGVERRYILAAEHQVTVQADLRVALDGQPRQLQLEVVVLVDNL